MEETLLEKGELEIKIVNEDVLLTYAGNGGSITAKIEGEYLLKKLADAIPGEIDDTIINILLAALKG